MCESHTARLSLDRGKRRCYSMLQARVTSGNEKKHLVDALMRKSSCKQQGQHDGNHVSTKNSDTEWLKQHKWHDASVE